MKILLVGEYSRLHNSLKIGLTNLGHEVTIISTGDGFKDFPSDIKVKQFFTTGFAKKWKQLWYKVFGQDLSSLAIAKEVKASKKKLSGFDVVQLINESPFNLQPKHEKEVVELLKTNNKKLFVLSCGTDYTSVKFAFNKNLRYSILDPHFKGKLSHVQSYPMLKYLEPEFKELHDFVLAQSDGFIASDIDYHLPLLGKPEYKGLIPNPVVIDEFEFQLVPITNKVVIFHGINREAYFKKGNDIFEQALALVNRTHEHKIEVITVESLPYSEYINKYNKAHIVLDQVYSYDQGYNALEAMAKGKVVFTGAETEFLEYYKLNSNSVAINALPDPEHIARELCRLINNPELIHNIGQAANAFVNKHHDCTQVAKMYLEVWKA